MKKNNSKLPRSVKENSIRVIILAKGSQKASYIRGRSHIMSATRGGGVVSRLMICYGKEQGTAIGRLRQDMITGRFITKILISKVF